MANEIRRRFYPGTKKTAALLKALLLYQRHEEEFDAEEIAEIDDFIHDLGGKHLVKMKLQSLFEQVQKSVEPIPFVREEHYETTGFPDPTGYVNWDKEDLEHRLWAHEDGMAVLPDDHVQAIREQLDIIRVREEEQKPRKISPPKPTE